MLRITYTERFKKHYKLLSEAEKKTIQKQAGIIC